MENAVIESVSHILDATRNSSLYNGGKGSVAEVKLKYKLNTRIECYNIMTTLLECSGHSKEVIDKVCCCRRLS